MKSLTTNAEDWRMRQMEMEDWIKDQIPNYLQNRISKFFEYKWTASEGVEDDMILRRYQQIFVRT
jgi:cyclic nucleotide gated channel